MNIQQKVDYRDLDQVNYSLHAKADIEKVQELVGQLRSEIINQLTSIKKETTGKTKKKEEELKKKKSENEFAVEKALEEIKVIKDKL